MLLQPQPPTQVAPAALASIDGSASELLRSNRLLLARVRELEQVNARLVADLQALRPPAVGTPAAVRRGALSAREREVLRLLSEGCRSPCIAERLGITLATVEVHRRNIMRKLGLHTVAALTRYALREGLIAL